MKRPTFLHSWRLCSTDESLLFLNRLILWSVYGPGLICFCLSVLVLGQFFITIHVSSKQSQPPPLLLPYDRYTEKICAIARCPAAYPFLLHESWLWGCAISEAAVAWIIILKPLFSSQNFAETWWARQVPKTETTVQGYKPIRCLIRKIGILVFKKNTLL